MTEPDGIERLAETWARLWAETLPPPPMLELVWVQEWWRLHRNKGQLLLIVARDEHGAPRGIAPLYLRAPRPDGANSLLRSVRFLGQGENEVDEVRGEYMTWLAAPGALSAVTQAVVEALKKHARLWDRLDFDCLRESTRIHEELPESLSAATTRRTRTAAPAYRSPALPLAAYLARIPSQKMRYQCRRALRQAETEGAVFVRASSDVEAEVMLDALAELHQRQWHKRGQPGVFSSALFTGFHRRMIRRYRQDGRLWLVGLRRGTEWMAVRYHIQAGSCLYDYISGVVNDGERAVLKPGIVLHLHTIDAAAAAGLRTYDFMGGDYEYKRRLAVEAGEMVSIELLGAGARARAWGAARGLWRRLRPLRGDDRPPPAGAADGD